MVTKISPEVRAAQKEVVIGAPQTEVSDEVMQKAQILIDRYTAQLTQKTNDYMMRKAAESEAAAPELATPVISGYQYWNCLSVGPIQFIGNPPYLPNRIVAANNTCLFLAAIWINPAPGPGASLPGTIVLGGRPFQLRFETVDLTAVTAGPSFTSSSTFASPAPVVTVIPWFFTVPDPGATPHLYEVNLTMDVTLGGQPFAGFGTWQLELDDELPFLGLPAAPAPGFQHDHPARMLAYHL